MIDFLLKIVKNGAKVRKKCEKSHQNSHQKMTKVTEKSKKMIQKWPFLTLFSQKIAFRAVGAKNITTFV